MKRMKFVLCLAMSVSFLAGCGNSTPSDWQYTREDAALFIVVDSELLQTDNENENILRITNASLLNDEIKDEDFMVFNYEKIRESEPADDYYSYQAIKANSVKAVKHELSEDGYTIDIYFEGDDEGLYGAIFNKDATYTGEFLFTVPELNTRDNDNEKDIDQFERELLESPNPKPDGYNYIDLISHFGQLCNKIPKEGENFAGIALSLAALTLAVYNFMKGLLTDVALPPNFHRFAELNNRLNLIDSKLNAISGTLTKILTTLQLEFDKTAVENCTRDIGDFQKYFVKPMEGCIRNYGDGLALAFKEMALNGTHVKVPYAKGDDGQFHRVPVLSKETPTDSSEGDIKFNNAKKYLDETGGRVDENFFKKVNEDISASVKDLTGEFPVPAGLTKERVANDITETIIENHLKTYFSDPKNFDESRDFRNIVMAYIDQFYEQNVEVVARYVKRCELTYNFSVEAERSLRNNLAGLMFDLEKNAAFAQMVCRFSGVPEEYLTTKYIAARDFIKAAYQRVKNLPSSFCFRNSQKWETKLFAFSDSVPGDPQEKRKTFTHQLKTYQVIPSSALWGYREEYDTTAHPLADSVTLQTATARFIALKATKDIDENVNLLDYFRKIPGLISAGSNRLIEHYAWAMGKENVVRLIGNTDTRFISNSETGMFIKCVAQGDKPNNPIFHLDCDYKYKDPTLTRARDTCWYNGTYYTADMIDENGVFTNKKDLIFYCDYHETSIGWLNQEYWAFSGTFVYRYNGNLQYSLYHYGLGVETTAL